MERNISQSPDSSHPDPHHEWVIRQFVYEDILHDLDQEFRTIGVTYMPIKGASLIRSGLAHKMPNRYMDDIDILVRKKDYERAAAHLLGTGKAVFKRHAWPFSKEFAYTACGHTCHLEINTIIDTPNRYVLDTEGLFGRARSTGGLCVLPSHEDALLILICHVITHIAFVFHESVFDEIELLSWQKGFDWRVFWERAQTTGIAGFITLVLHLYARRSGRSLPIPDLRLYPRVLLRFCGLTGYASLPPAMRRLLWELPLARRPMSLAAAKLRARAARRNSGGDARYTSS